MEASNVYYQLAELKRQLETLDSRVVALEAEDSVKERRIKELAEHNAMLTLLFDRVVPIIDDNQRKLTEIFKTASANDEVLPSQVTSLIDKIEEHVERSATTPPPNDNIVIPDLKGLKR